jgi:hypothetical protein
LRFPVLCQLFQDQIRVSYTETRPQDLHVDCAIGLCPVGSSAHHRSQRVQVRDSKDRNGDVLRFSPVAWRPFIERINLA